MPSSGILGAIYGLVQYAVHPGDDAVALDVSIIIPNRNGSNTIGACLQAALASQHPDFEIVVVDDCSDDNSVSIIEQFPCRLVRLADHGGAARARNIGAQHGQGKILFFTDADCLLNEDTLTKASEALAAGHSDQVVGGTYTRQPADDGFYNRFQSIFINYSETKHASHPDYVATHAMAISADSFRTSGGFPESLGPILEDVAFSHRLRRQGIGLVLNPDIQVRHVFNFSLLGSLRNAFHKSMYWTMYSIDNKDLLADSGTASLELKANVVAYYLSWLLLFLSLATGQWMWWFAIGGVQIVNVVTNKRLLLAFCDPNDILFSLAAVMYYLVVYPLPVGLGAMVGMIRYWRNS
jgi:glycosyltransferase involved in cell wall biosynthesis